MIATLLWRHTWDVGTYLACMESGGEGKTEKYNVKKGDNMEKGMEGNHEGEV